ALQTGRGASLEDFFEKAAFEFDMTAGSFSRPVIEEVGECRWIQHDTTIHPGNPGGPLLTEDRTAVGINTLSNARVHGDSAPVAQRAGPRLMPGKYVLGGGAATGRCPPGRRGAAG